MTDKSERTLSSAKHFDLEPKTVDKLDTGKVFEPSLVMTNEDIECEPIKVEHSKAPLLSLTGGHWLLYSSIFILAISLYQTVNFIFSSWASQPVLVALTLGAISCLTYGLAKIVKHEWRSLQSLKKQQKLMDSFNRQGELTVSYEQAIVLCQEHLSSLNEITLAAPTEQFLSQLAQSQSAADVAQLYHQTVLTELDKQAKTIISQTATELTLLTAVSPLALLDSMLVLYKQGEMIHQLAQLYGIKLSYWQRIRFIKQIITNSIVTAGSEALLDIGMDVLGVELAGKLSARAGQGLAVGLLTSRLGLSAIDSCRPLPTKQALSINLKDIKQTLLSRLKQVNQKS